MFSFPATSLARSFRSPPARAGEGGALTVLKHALYEAFFCEGEDIRPTRSWPRAARTGLDPDEAVAAAYDAGLIGRIATVREEAERAGVAGVPTLLTEDGRTHWGTGGVERLLAGEPLVPRA